MESDRALSPAERRLRWMLILSGVITSLAVVAVFMPLNWMALIHQHLDIGPLPADPVFEYLARSVSALYAVHGGLCFLLAANVRRYGPIITYLAIVAIVFAFVILWIDYKANLPWPWIAAEAPSVLILGILILCLRLRAARDPLRSND